MSTAAPLADLHRHLDGSLRRATLDELAAAAGLAVPDDVGFRPGMGLDQALACFRLTLAVLQDLTAIRRVAAELCTAISARTPLAFGRPRRKIGRACLAQPASP